MTRYDHAVLIAEIGSVTTRVTLVDMVAGDARMIGRIEVPSTIEPPQENAAVAILAAANEISEMTGRRLIEGTSLIMPQNNERDGVDQVVAVTSAAGIMGVVIAAIATDISGHSAQRAIRATYASVVQTITLDNSVRTEEGRDTTWIERQVQMLTGLHPDVVLITGGLEDGAQDSLVRLAHIVGLTALSTRVDQSGTQRQDVTARSVLFAGNSKASERMIEALSGRARLKVIDNVRPSLDVERLDPIRNELRRIYDERILPNLPGAAALKRLCSTPLRTSAEASALMVRFIAELNHRSVLSIDIGSAATILQYVTQDVATPVVLANTGTGLGLGEVLANSGPNGVRRWLPFPIGEREISHRLLNKMLRPQIQPTSREDLLIELAAAREALSLAVAALHDERPHTSYDLVIAGGGVLAHAPHPGLAALVILDALQPSAEQSVMAIDIHLDPLGLLTACGALAFANPEAALTLFEHDLLSNTPLATCIVALGEGHVGTIAVEAELRIANQEPITISVAHGQIARLPLEIGQRGQLILRPTSGVRIGRNTPGAEVSSEVGALAGSALGVVIDARGRPLHLPDDFAQRQQALWDWMVALGVESGPLPYETTAPAPEATPPILPIFVPAAEASLTPDAVATPESDLARLRQTVAEPKRKGFFNRK
ncbi:MAG: glutamate mutase L [Roseiflexaceae bacterium]|nr:glutamate mutase L [Roseiflexaceae bacterium]